jgi:hypothetical protein
MVAFVQVNFEQFGFSVIDAVGNRFLNDLIKNILDLFSNMGASFYAANELQFGKERE